MIDAGDGSILDTIILDADVRGLAVDTNGEFFGASWDDNIYHFDTDGTQLNMLVSGGSDLTDIDLGDDGTIVVGERFGNVIVTDTTLIAVTDSWSAGATPTFVTLRIN